MAKDIFGNSLNYDLMGNKLKDNKRTISSGEKKWLWQLKERHICPICHKQIKDFFDAEFDHKKAYANGGKTTIANTLILHRQCNRIKGNKTMTEVKKRLGTHIKKTKIKTTTKTIKKKSVSSNNPLALPKDAFKMPVYKPLKIKGLGW